MKETRSGYVKAGSRGGLGGGPNTFQMIRQTNGSEHWTAEERLRVTSEWAPMAAKEFAKEGMISEAFFQSIGVPGDMNLDGSERRRNEQKDVRCHRATLLSHPRQVHTTHTQASKMTINNDDSSDMCVHTHVCMCM